MNTPVCIGGVGGSGTRLFAQILDLLHFNTGDFINDTWDNLYFTFLFKRLETLNLSQSRFLQLFSIFQKIMLHQEYLNIKDKQIIENLYIKHTKQNYIYNKKGTYEQFLKNYNLKNNNNNVKWGWKEPNTHILLPKLLKLYPKIKYIHIMRNGLDMAFSKNQNQLKFWTNLKPTPQNSLHYWVKVHKKLVKYQIKFPQNIYILDFDTFCLNPDTQIPLLLKFLNIQYNKTIIQKIKSIIKIPNSIGRYKNHDLSSFNQYDLDFIKSIGYL
jgi:hypothetical protein